MILFHKFSRFEIFFRSNEFVSRSKPLPTENLKFSKSEKIKNLISSKKDCRKLVNYF